MVWNLLLAHFLGDFFFQTDWMVRNRAKLWVLSIHASIHFVLMLIFAGASRSTLWPYLLLIAGIHFSVDRIKIILTDRRPDWTPVAFVVDQALHYATIWIVSLWFLVEAGSLSALVKSEWVIVAIGYLIVTRVSFISERVFYLSNTDYVQNINSTKIPRMLTRAGLISVFLLFRNWPISGLALVLPNPYPPSKFRQRAVLTDLGISLLAMLFLFLALT